MAVKCTAKSKQSGERCKKYPTPGSNVCATHGSKSPRAQVAAAKRLALEAAMRSETPRKPWEVLEEALHAVDVLMKQALVKLDKGDSMSPKDYTELVAAVERAHRMAKVNLDAGIDARRLRLAEAQAGQMHKIFTRVLNALNLTPEQRALVPGLLKQEIRAAVRPAIEGQVVANGNGS